MARDSLPSLTGDSIHGQTRASLMRLHQQSLEKTIQSSITAIHTDDSDQGPGQRCKRKKKKYSWVQRDSQRQREKIGLEGSRRRQRHDNDKFVHHPFAVLYQADLAFPGFGHNIPSFHWKYDSMIESLIRNNPPASRRSRAKVYRTDRESDTEEEEGEDATEKARAHRPCTGHHRLTRAQRKDIKKVHVPKGIVMQYEGELVQFLDQLTLVGKPESLEKEMTIQKESDSAGSEAKSSSWVFVKAPAAESETESDPEVQADADVKETKTNNGQSGQQREENVMKTHGEDDKENYASQIYLAWDIQDQFLRFVAHALVSFYGLVSFSKTAVDGKRLLYVCHPTHFDSISALTSLHTTESLAKAVSSLSLSKSASRHPPRRQRMLEHVQELPQDELDQLWRQIKPTKVSGYLQPEMTFFEYLYPSTRPMF